ncbi:hypothetical protein EDC04DRAFT_2871692 [Pisolithus marmoratus]|nr:hypothetical protein EDC04DRAFT_2871692 [Pisolithus marmoratus]
MSRPRCASRVLVKARCSFCMPKGIIGTYSRKSYEGLSRKLILAFDVGTKFSGVSYCIVDPGEIPAIRVFPAQEHFGGDNKIPSIPYHDKGGRPPTVVTETRQPYIIGRAEEEEWVRLEWWKLHFRSKYLEAPYSDADPPQLPNDKLAVEVLGDFMCYFSWDSLGDRIEFILRHPNSWEGPQQQPIRKPAELAGLVPVGEDGQSCVRLLSEGEASASLHFRIYGGVILIDAGSGTVDLNAYSMTLSPTSFREIAPAERRLQGSVFATYRAHAFLRGQTQRNGNFGGADEPQYIKFGTIRDKEAEYNIRSRQLKLTEKDVAKLFEPSVEETIAAFEVQRKAAEMPITKYMSSLRTTFCRPGQHVNMAVADRAVSYYLDRLGSGRAVKFTYGIPLHGDLLLPNGFGTILTRGTEVFEQREFRSGFYREEAELSACKSVAVDIVAYRETLQSPLWVNKLASSLRPSQRRNGLGVYYTLNFDVVMPFGLMELKAQISWKENMRLNLVA